MAVKLGDASKELVIVFHTVTLKELFTGEESEEWIYSIKMTTKDKSTLLMQMRDTHVELILLDTSEAPWKQLEGSVKGVVKYGFTLYDVGTRYIHFKDDILVITDR